MKLAFVCNEYPPGPHGGIGTFVQQFGQALVEAGHQVFVFGIGAVSEVRLDGQIRVATIAHRDILRVSWITKRLQFWLFVRGQVKRHLIDIVETTDFLGLLPFGLGCTVVVRLHLTATSIALQNKVRPGPSNRLFEGLQLRVHGNWLALSQYAMDLTLETFPGVKPKRAEVIGPPISVPRGLPDVSDYPDSFVLFAGYVSTRKGAVALARAARIFLNHFPDLHVVYAGTILTESGVPVDRTIREILGPELSGRTVFSGYLDRSKVFALMAKARAFVFPSQLETFGLVVAEAMLQGCPVVTSNAGPFPEFVRNEESGLLVDVADIDAISDAVVKLIRDRKYAMGLAKRGKDFVANSYSRERHLRENLRFYEQCLLGG